MNEILVLIGAFFAGILLGFLFFGGLWFTTRKSLSSKIPVIWIFGSFVLRTALLLLGFYYVADGDWKRVLICLLGFVIARILTNRMISLTRSATKMEVENET